MINEIKQWPMTKKKAVLQTYDALHSMPELATQEYKTAAYVAEFLQSHGIEVVTGIANTGLVAYVRSDQPGPVLALRADMDALNHIVDDQLVTMHTCGHDAHTTMVLFAGLMAKELNLVKKGTLKLIFQPSEEQETTSGARAMARAGVLDEVDMCIGIHLRPIQEAKMNEAIAALKHGALTIINGEVIGQMSHSGRPHMGKNPIDAIASIVHAVNAIWVDPGVPASAKMIAVQSGDPMTTSIPEKGHVTVDLRADNNETMDELIRKVSHAIQAGAATIGCEGQVNVVPGLPAPVYDESMIQIAREAITEVLGSTGMLGIKRTTGADDFHEFTRWKPELKTTYIGLGCDLTPGLHHPDMSFNRDALLNGIRILSVMVHRILGV